MGPSRNALVPRTTHPTENIMQEKTETARALGFRGAVPAPHPLPCPQNKEVYSKNREMRGSIQGECVLSEVAANFIGYTLPTVTWPPVSLSYQPQHGHPFHPFQPQHGRNRLTLSTATLPPLSVSSQPQHGHNRLTLPTATWP